MTTPLAKRLRLKPGQRGLALNIPPDYAELLGPLPENLELTSDSSGGPFDFVHLFVHDRAQLDHYGPLALQAIKPDGLFWISWPKRTSGIKTDLTRDDGWETLHEAGWEGVATVSVDDVWSAIRFRPRDQITWSTGGSRAAHGRRPPE